MCKKLREGGRDPYLPQDREIGAQSYDIEIS